MSEFQGKFQYLAQNGNVLQEGACCLRFDAQTIALTPESSAALAFDLGDLDAVVAANYEVRLPLYMGSVIVLRQLGKSYENLAHQLNEAFRNRTVQCLLLEDMGEVARFNANVELSGTGTASGPSEIRLYKSNLAVLPAASRSFQWRLADIDEVNLDTNAYEVVLQSGGEQLKVSRLARRTEEFTDKIREARIALARHSAEALHDIFPFLDPDQLRSCTTLLGEGRSAPLAKLAAVHKQIPAALATNAVDDVLKPFYERLVALAVEGMGYAGFKLIRSDDENAGMGKSGNDSAARDSDSAPDTDPSAPETLYWFFFPLAAKPGSPAPANVVAWEAISRSGRATYLFRLVAPEHAAQLADPTRAAALVDTAIRRLTRVLAMLNFRRRPIYLSDDELAMDARFHRYAIAARRQPEVREARAAFLGRVLHSSPEAWQEQVESILQEA